MGPVLRILLYFMRLFNKPFFFFSFAYLWTKPSNIYIVRLNYDVSSICSWLQPFSLDFFIFFFILIFFFLKRYTYWNAIYRWKSLLSSLLYTYVCTRSIFPIPIREASLRIFILQIKFSVLLVYHVFLLLLLLFNLDLGMSMRHKITFFVFNLWLAANCFLLLLLLRNI